MKLFEYQAKETFKRFGIAVPESVVITSINELRDATDKTGFPLVLKSQVLMGGRGKAGLIPFVRDLKEAEEKCAELFASKYNVNTILVEEAVDIKKEIYLSVTVDPVSASFLIIASAAGGVEIETIAVVSPEKIIRELVDPNLGLMPYQIKDIAFRLGLVGDVLKIFSSVLAKLYEAFVKNDAELIEINPLFITGKNDVIAGDGKLSIDDNSTFRQNNYEKTRDYYDSDAEYEAALEGIPYLQFDGDISLMCAGAGLTTTVYDLINYEGGTVANYLEFGGPNYKKAVKAMELCLKNDSKVILMVTFGTIARADVMARGIVDAINRLKPDRPIVTCIRGTNEEEASRILLAAGLEPIYDTEEAVRKAVSIAAGGK
ncbi:MAG: acetate--CoA ligase family protein [Spirochaetaceae bacterium]|jgi:succinyl-CoA synthetase beta subunit|nr:acetate--CoA ligase family protein [Spirochaetaceae bacterium]